MAKRGATAGTRTISRQRQPARIKREAFDTTTERWSGMREGGVGVEEGLLEGERDQRDQRDLSLSVADGGKMRRGTTRHDGKSGES